jgi:hypothetical protein
MFRRLIQERDYAMKSSLKWLLTVVTTALVVVLAVGAGAIFAQEPETTPTPESAAPSGPRAHGFGWGGLRGGFGQSEYLADALGITTDELSAATQQARAAALQQAVEEGLITQEQADRMAARIAGRGFHLHGFRGGSIDGQALLADALNISVEQLEAAMETARDTALAAAVAEGRITQEQADQLQNGERFFGPGGHRGFGGHGFRGPRGIFPGAPGNTTPSTTPSSGA